VQWRILVPSASVPPSSGTPGLWRRKSGTGAVDAQGLGLTHPMTWIDERLFGWSRSAKRGTSAWGGFSGDEGSRLPTPDETDDEDSGDYDNVIGIIPTGDDQLHPAQKSQKSRSRQSSYADLQRLRLSPLPRPSDTVQQSESVGSSTAMLSTEAEAGMNLRQGHRTRRESLSDGVSVSRIAAVDRAEQFANATQDLNDEIDRKRTQSVT
jgi:glycerol-3-phosphate O-acyltransferase/dihydroxyacetone phosphate acyltransferase